MLYLACCKHINMCNISLDFISLKKTDLGSPPHRAKAT